MKAVLGFGHNAEGTEELDLVRRLAFKDFTGYAIRVVEHITAPFFSTHAGLSQDVIDRYIRDEEIFHKAELEKVIRSARGKGLSLQSDLRQGHSAANGIMEAAADLGADLIVTGCRTSGRLGKIVTGSVTRKLAAASPKSLLVARNLASAEGPVHAVFATDHSDYAHACLDELLRLSPKGFGKITVMTAYPKQFFEEVMKFQENFRGDVGQWMESELQKQNARVIDKLMPLGCPLESLVLGAQVDDAIKEALSKTRAELLILGSQGHGFLERLGSGSVSFDQVTSGETSVLVLRVPVKEA